MTNYLDKTYPKIHYKQFSNTHVTLKVNMLSNNSNVLLSVKPSELTTKQSLKD